MTTEDGVFQKQDNGKKEDDIISPHSEFSKGAKVFVPDAELGWKTATVHAVLTIEGAPVVACITDDGQELQVSPFFPALLSSLLFLSLSSPLFYPHIALLFSFFVLKLIIYHISTCSMIRCLPRMCMCRTLVFWKEWMT